LRSFVVRRHVTHVTRGWRKIAISLIDLRHRDFERYGLVNNSYAETIVGVTQGKADQMSGGLPVENLSDDCDRICDASVAVCRGTWAIRDNHFPA
jgi:hypothetical protein